MSNRKRLSVCVFVVIILLLLLVFWKGIINVNEDRQMLERITNGDYSGFYMEEEAHFSVEELKQTLERGEDKTEWHYWKLENGGEALVLREKNWPNRYNESIIGVFTISNNEVICNIWDVSDMGAFYFLGNGNLIYRKYYNGTYQFNSYSIFGFDAEFRDFDARKKLEGGLEIYKIENMDELPSDWDDLYPDMDKEGLYFKHFQMENDGEEIRRQDESITEREWLEEFQNITGNSFQVMEPDAETFNF